jgi:hypothetical protein
MIAQRILASALALPLLLAGCGGERTPATEGQGSSTPEYVRADIGDPLESGAATPVRIGELGPNFAACNARGATRERAGADHVPVRPAPFDSAEEIDRLPAGAEFFICSRSHDQRWFGIVYDSGGVAAERCGVSAPVGRRSNYEGPCAAGWVPSNLVRLISGVPHQLSAGEAPAR